MNLNFFSSVLMSFSPLRVQCMSFLSNVDIFAWSSIWLPSYHKLHIWLEYGCQERFMVVNPGMEGYNLMGGGTIMGKIQKYKPVICKTVRHKLLLFLQNKTWPYPTSNRLSSNFLLAFWDNLTRRPAG